MISRISLFLLFLCLFQVTRAQEITRESLLKRRPSITNHYDTNYRQPNQYFLHMDFAGSAILNPEDFRSYYNRQIDRIELFYTDFKVSDSFRQSTLNGRRLEEL